MSVFTTTPALVTQFKLQPCDSKRQASESQLSISLCQQNPVAAPRKKSSLALCLFFTVVAATRCTSTGQCRE